MLKLFFLQSRNVVDVPPTAIAKVNGAKERYYPVGWSLGLVAWVLALRLGGCKKYRNPHP